MNFIDTNSKHIISLYNNGKDSSKYDYYHSLGVDKLKEHKWGIVILSGGQGTRLGSDKPKGLFEIEGKTIFEWHMDTIKENIRKYGTRIKVFIMTSSYTHMVLDEFFKMHDFGIEVVLFQQDEEICVDLENNNLPYYQFYATAPNGNGNVFKKINELDISDIYGFNVISVDNVLATVLDPAFVGAFCSNGYDILSKSITKKKDESMGTFVVGDDGKMKVIEYSESKCTQDNLQGNICNHLFRREFVQFMKDKKLPVHLAKKKIPFTRNGELIKPETPNGFKKELFIFDCFEFTDKNGIFNVPREQEFSPLKNKVGDGPDNPETCGLALRSTRLKSATK